MWIEAYRVTSRVSLAECVYHWRLCVDGEEYVAVSDNRMGSVMAAQRELIRLVAKDHGQEISVTTGPASDAIVFKTIEIEKSVTQPGYRVFVESGNFSFTAYMDPTIESFLAVWSACMKFFAAKYGIVYLYDEVARNVEAAREQGMS